ncbi:MAG: hypothetical protein HY650_12840 [Acidobacteria bacterium]|nr:hypothetical protein [Acidobacteriota bacterium]
MFKLQDCPIRPPAWAAAALVVASIFLPGSPVSGTVSNCFRTSVGLTPLMDLGTGYYKGYQGGLYPDGSNQRPSAHEAAGLAMAMSVRPLDGQGNPSPQGRIVLLSIGMSNTTQEFSVFKSTADRDPEKNPLLTIVDGAQGGMPAERISNPDDGDAGTRFWTVVDQRLASSGVTPAQVQIAWVKQANAGPRGVFPADERKLQAELATIAQILKTRFSNIKLAYYSSRIYGGYASTGLNPEPYAYQAGFSVKWLVEDQINGAAGLNFDPVAGPVRAPWLAWGPYLWADGLQGRTDGLQWECEDFQPSDGTHPAESARQKVSSMLLNFFKSDPTARPWFPV